MESSIQNKLREFQAECHVFWSLEFTGYFSNNDEFNLRDLIDENVVVVYMDDILVYTEDLKQHRKIVKEVL
jgi:hypothetical protein